MIRTVVRLVVLVVSAAAGGATAHALEAPVAAGGVAGALAGGAAVLLEIVAASLPIERLVWGVAGGLAGLGVGLVLGLVAAALVAQGQAAVVALALALGAYVGAAVALGRLADLSAISARLFPATRGGRGLEVLGRLQRIPGLTVEIAEVDIAGVEDVDRKLLELARRRGGRIVTNDYNLNKLAELARVAVLNVNELANAVKPVMLPGEAMTVQVLREDKESGQGVGYLDDGTMVVIEQGRRYIGQALDVVVTSVLQTPAGRMIFTRPRDDAPSAVTAPERADA